MTVFRLTPAAIPIVGGSTFLSLSHKEIASQEIDKAKVHIKTPIPVEKTRVVIEVLNSNLTVTTPSVSMDGLRILNVSYMLRFDVV